MLVLICVDFTPLQGPAKTSKMETLPAMVNGLFCCKALHFRYV